MNEINLKQPIKAQSKPIAMPSAKKFNFIAFLIKLIIIIAFFVGAYILLNNLGIIEKVKEGFLLLNQI